MRHGIPEFRPRQPLDRQLTAATLNDIRKELESLRITRVNNGTFRKLPGGTEITVAPQRGGGGVATPRLPWDLIAVPDPESTAENPPYKVTVQPGTLNSILPTNWDDEFTCNATGLYYAKAVISTDGEAITGVSIDIDTSEPQSQSPQLFGIEASIEYLFGLFSEGQTYRVVGDGNIRLSLQAGPIVNPPSPRQFGELPYDIYYQLA
jgi:hypothetical protein